MGDVWKDRSGRVPFSVLGVFLIIGSSITSTIYINLENTVSEETTFSLGAGELSSMLSFMEADISVALNYAGMSAMDFVGKHPVTKPNRQSEVARGYNGGSWDNLNENGEWNNEAFCTQFNMNWTKNITRVKLNPYIQGNYMDDVYCNGKYAINVVDPHPEREGGPVHNWSDITVTEVTMHLDREHTSPGPFIPNAVRDIFVAHPSNEDMPAYWEFSLPLQVEIKDVGQDKIIGRRTISISTLVNSRMPLLRELTESYEKCLTGDGDITDNKLFILMTLLSELYTEGRALAQYGGMYERIPNIVDTRWLRYLVNGVLLLEQFMVFNSIDPAAAIYLLLNAGDLAATGFPEEEAIQMFVSEAADEAISSIFGEPDEELLNTIANDTMEELRERANASMNHPDAKREINITQLAEDILYDTSYRYYYYNKTDEGIYLQFTNETFLGYNATIDGHKCFYMHPPPYYYYNKTFYEQHGYNLSKEQYEGEFINELIEGELLTFNYTLNNNSASSHTSGCERVVRHALSPSAMNKLERTIDETYKARFTTSVSRQVLDGYPKYDPSKSSYYDCRQDGGDTWHFVSATPVGSHLSDDDGITHFPYTEVWEVEWNQTHWYGHLTPQYVNGTYVGDICEGNGSFTYVKKERVTFTIYGEAAVNVNETPEDDVDTPFTPIDVNFGHGEKKDYNLFNISKTYVRNHFLDFRYSILHSETTGTNSFHNEGENPYGMGWLMGYGGEVELALREILEQIKRDNITVNVNNTEFRHRDFNDTIDNHTDQLLAKYRPHMQEYINDEAYRNISTGNYKSCAARVIAKMREWYVNEIETRLEQARNEIKNSITGNIREALRDHETNINLGDREAARNCGVEAGDLPALQFGLTMPLTKSGEHYQRNEQVGFSIDQEPDYFNTEEASSTTYNFLIQNICLFGPSGLPLLPTPVTPWIITINCWYIHVEGQFTRFEVIDTVGEMQPNALFGNTDYSYVRKDIPIYDISSPRSIIPIGWNKPIKFRVDTVNVAVVPPGFVGDINPSSYTTEMITGEGYPHRNYG